MRRHAEAAGGARVAWSGEPMIQKAITVRAVLELGEELLQERRRSYDLSTELRRVKEELERAERREKEAWSRRNAAVHEASVLRRQVGQRKGRKS